MTHVFAFGPLEVFDSEGGFGPDEIQINGASMAEIVARLYGLAVNDRGSLGNLKLGNVCLVLERLPDDALPREDATLEEANAILVGAGYDPDVVNDKFSRLVNALLAENNEVQP